MSEPIDDFDWPNLNAVESTDEYILRRPIKAKMIETQKRTFYLVEHFGMCALLNVEQFNSIFQKVEARENG